MLRILIIKDSRLLPWWRSSKKKKKKEKEKEKENKANEKEKKKKKKCGFFFVEKPKKK
jgi:hypothetical protein